jgi:hypothetical protein
MMNASHILHEIAIHNSAPHLSQTPHAANCDADALDMLLQCVRVNVRHSFRTFDDWRRTPLGPDAPHAMIRSNRGAAFASRFSVLVRLPTSEPLESRTLLSTYYVSPTGNDLHSGASSASPWRTIAKVNAVAFKPGDTILFQAGHTFGGTLKPKTGGTSSSPITFGSYGSGRAIISSGGGDGAVVLNKGGIGFVNLKFVGSPNGRSQDGVHFETTGGSYANIRVDHCEITGYGGSGLRVFGNHETDGFSNIRITYDSIHDNVDTGITINALTNNVHRNVYVGHNDVYNTWGTASHFPSGSGIVVGCVNGAVVERNTSHNNGYKGGDGVVGVWTFASTGVWMQYNEAYNNHSMGHADGDGIDFDADTQNSVMQYNYSHDNDGAGLMFDQWKSNARFTNDVMRYNVSQNNGHKNGYCDINVFGQIYNSAIYNNDIYCGVATAAVKIAFSALGGSYVRGLHLANNIIETTGGRPLINVAGNELQGSNLSFVADDYWTNGGAVRFNFGKTYNSLSAWQGATGQEKLKGKSVGMFVNPQLNYAGGGQTKGAENLSSLSAYRLKSTSPLINRGVNVSSLYGMIGVSHDFYINRVPQGAAYDIGVDEVR